MRARLPRLAILTCIALQASCLPWQAKAATTASAVMLVSATIEPSCHLETSPIEFAPRNSARPRSDAEGAIAVECTPEVSFAVTLDAGRNPLGSRRRLVGASSGAFLDYDVYTDVARTRPWAKGAAGAVAHVAPANGGAVTIPAFARLISTRATADLYTDQMIVTVAF